MPHNEKPISAPKVVTPQTSTPDSDGMDEMGFQASDPTKKNREYRRRIGDLDPVP